jgi:hypothetical protein
MIYFFHERSFSRNQNPFVEGQDDIDGVYFIKSGEFEITKKVQQNIQSKQESNNAEALFN